MMTQNRTKTLGEMSIAERARAIRSAAKKLGKELSVLNSNLARIAAGTLGFEIRQDGRYRLRSNKRIDNIGCSYNYVVTANQLAALIYFDAEGHPRISLNKLDELLMEVSSKDFCYKHATPCPQPCAACISEC